MFQRSSHSPAWTMLSGLSNICWGLVAVLSLGFVILNKFTPMTVARWQMQHTIATRRAKEKANEAR